MNRQQLKLYITGRTGRSQKAVHNLRALLDTYGNSQFEFVVVDVLENPEKAEEDKILATPTLLCETPERTCRIIGDFSDTAQTLQLLGLAGGKPVSGNYIYSEERNESRE